MNLLDSKNVNNRTRKRTIALAVFVHLYLSLMTFGFWLIPLTIFGVITSALLRTDIFDAMVAALDKNGIDTSDLKAQNLQSMNINIPGGKVNMGNMVQDAMNKIGAAVSGAKA